MSQENTFRVLPVCNPSKIVYYYKEQKSPKSLKSFRKNEYFRSEIYLFFFPNQNFHFAPCPRLTVNSKIDYQWHVVMNHPTTLAINSTAWFLKAAVIVYWSIFTCTYLSIYLSMTVECQSQRAGAWFTKKTYNNFYPKFLVK